MTYHSDIVDFNLENLTVKVGDTVLWHNHDVDSHTVASSLWSSSGDLPQGASFSHTFTQAGTFDYLCEYHPGAPYYMTATLTVNP